MTITEAIAWLNTDDYESTGYNKAIEMAIKALESLEMWNGSHGQYFAPKGTFEKIYNDDKALESQPKWIPTSERLPEEQMLCLGDTRDRGATKCVYFKNSDFWKEFVVAWMPLPQPFKAESEG